MAISDQAVGDHAIGDIGGGGIGPGMFAQGYVDFVDSPTVRMSYDTTKGVFRVDCDIQKMTVNL